jgi:hypothetical protein
VDSLQHVGYKKAGNHAEKAKQNACTHLRPTFWPNYIAHLFTVKTVHRQQATKHIFTAHGLEQAAGPHIAVRVKWSYQTIRAAEEVWSIAWARATRHNVDLVGPFGRLSCVADPLTCEPRCSHCLGFCADNEST